MSTDYTLETIQVSLSAQDRFAEYLQSRGMRNTCLLYTSDAADE